MKLADAYYASNEEREKLYKELNITLNVIHCCSCLVVRKNDMNIILKDRWHDPYKSDEENIRTVCDKDFLVISRQLLTRANKYCRNSEVIYAGDNLLIVL